MDPARIGWSVLRIAVLTYAGLCAILYLRQSRMVYFPLRRVSQSPADIGLPFDAVTLRTQDGVALDAWFVPRDGARGAVLLCHGNGGNIGHRLPAVALFHELGFHVMIFDYRGYGRSEGQPSEAGTYRDARAAWEWLTGPRGLAPEQIVVAGRSLGGAVAAALAEETGPAALILEATFTSLPDLAAGLYPWLPVRWLCRFRYNTRSCLPRIACPVLVAHSRADEIVPFAHGRRLFEAARPPRMFFELRGEHNEGELLTDPAYRQALEAFLAGALGG